MSDGSKHWWQTLPAIIAGVATLLTAITGLLVTLHQLGVFKKPDNKPNESASFAVVAPPTASARDAPQNPPRKEPDASRLALGRVTFITDQSDSVKALVTYLEQKGAEVSVIPTSRFDDLAGTRPDVVIIGTDTGAVWDTLSKTILRQIFENLRVIAFGSGGANLFLQLGLKISGPNGMHGTGSRVAVQSPELLQSPMVVPEEDKVVETYHRGQADVIGIYDRGSPILGGFEGIARWTDHKGHWPICRQGNFLFWGFSAPSGDMTEPGKRLFVNLLLNHKTRAAVPLSQAQTKVEYVKSGRISDRLSKQFPTHRWPFQVKRTGHINARLSWNPPDKAVALILGTQHRRRFQRKDGTSPLTIDFDVNEEDVARSDDDWHISVTCFGDLGTTVIDYKLELSIPKE